jgi:hypothetical protein
MQEGRPHGNQSRQGGGPKFRLKRRTHEFVLSAHTLSNNANEKGDGPSPPAPCLIRAPSLDRRRSWREGAAWRRYDLELVS